MKTRVIIADWSYSPAHELKRADAIAVAVAGRLNRHIYVLEPSTFGCGETINLFFAAHPDCALSDKALQDLIQRVIAPLAEHSLFDVLPPQWTDVPDGLAYYDGRTNVAWSVEMLEVNRKRRVMVWSEWHV